MLLSWLISCLSCQCLWIHLSLRTGFNADGLLCAAIHWSILHFSVTNFLSLHSYLSSSSAPSLLFFITLVSFCYFPGAFSFILCLLQGWTEGWGRRRSEGARNRRVSQHGSVSFINIRFSQRDALKANSETSLLALRTKSPAPPSLFTPLSPFTNRYLSESDCMGLFSFQKRWHIKMIERNI